MAALLLAVGGCTGAAPSSDLAPLAWSKGDSTHAAPGPCALLSPAEVEQALSATIVSSRRRDDGGLTRALTFTLPDDVCEYHGLRVAASEPAPVARRSASAELLDGADMRTAALDDVLAGGGIDDPQAQAAVTRLRTLELSVSVSPETISRAEFDARYERRVAAFARHAAVATEPGPLMVDPRFVEHATDGAKDIGAVGDAARWYPAMAQLEVLVGETAFAVSRVRQAPLVGAPLLGEPAALLDDPPQELVDIARLAAERL